MPSHTEQLWEVSSRSIDGTRVRLATTVNDPAHPPPTHPPLLLVMGIGGNLDMWRPLARQLPGRRLIAFDAPGTGQSSIGRLRRMPGLADLTAKLLDDLGHPQVDVLGYSFGGALAQELAHRHPQRVRRLILGATMCGLGGIPGRPDVLFHLSHPLRYRSQRYLRWVSPRIYGGRARFSSEHEHFSARLGNPPSASGYLSQLYAISWWTSLPWLHRLRMPVLILAGDDDPIIPLVNAKILAARIPDAELVVIRGGGHLFLLDQSEDAIAPIEAFLSDAVDHPAESSGSLKAAAIAR
jgi:poly(3-hydroxyalkanoate) depolymerase